MLGALPPLPTSYNTVFTHENNLAFTYKHINILVYRTHIDRWEIHAVVDLTNIL
jgi:hypothetical protein